MKTGNARIIKVQSKVIPANHFRNYIIYPKLILSGRWLEAAGINYGDSVKIKPDPEHKGRLIIETI